jgi:hypothetical protein
LDRPFPAYDGDDSYVFVCYAHDDAKIVYPEIRWLREQGVNIWYDEGISPGAEFPERLGKAILGASLVLFYVSPTSVNSRHCRDEVYFGIDRTTPILAIHIAETEISRTVQTLRRFLPNPRPGAPVCPVLPFPCLSLPQSRSRHLGWSQSRIT